MATYQETQDGTRLAPEVDANGGPGTNADGQPVGLPLTDSTGYRLVLSAAAGQTLEAAGDLECWLYSAGLKQWARAPGMDVAVAVDGGRAQAFTDVTVRVGNADRVLFACAGVTAAGVAEVPAEQDKFTVRLDGQSAWR